MKSIDFQSLRQRMRREVRGRYGSVRSRFQTSDVLQESTLQLIGEFRAKGSNIPVTQSWLKKIARGHGLNLRKFHEAECRSVRQEVPSDPNQFCAPLRTEAEVEKREMLAQLSLAIARLETLDRQIIDSRFFQKTSFLCIAEHMQRSESWVRRRYQSALRELKATLAQGH